jgi:hypothetical protein
MYVDCTAPVVSLRDAGRFQVAVEDAHKTIGYLEDGMIARQARRDRLASSQSFRLESAQLVVEPALQIFRQIAAKNHAVSFPVLLVFGVEFDMRNRTVKPKLGDGQARQLAPPEPG